MTGLLVLSVLAAWCLWLLRRDGKDRAAVSPAIWLVLAWAVIYASRPVTSWFSGPAPSGSFDEGTPGEALVYVILIAAGLMVLSRRNIRLAAAITDNRWMFVFYLFWLMSVVWSEYPVITLKRLVKDLGNIVMVLIMFTERQPFEAVKAVFAKCAYVCIPLSLVLIRYFPDVGRAYVGYDVSEVMHVGVATHKNALGALVLVSSLFVLWDYLEARGKRSARGTGESIMRASRLVVLLMCWYLLLTIDSATSLICAVLGSMLLVGAHIPAVKQRPGRAEAYGCGAVVSLWALDFVFDLKGAFVRSLGRDMTLTTRTDVWPVLIAYQDNPLIGAGFNSFWAGGRLVELRGSVGEIIQAHNGYLETYLNGGIVALGLLIVLLFSAYGRIRQGLVSGAPEAWIRFVFLLLVVIHNGSEASFNKVSILWFVMVVTLMESGALQGSREARADGLQWSAAGGTRQR